LPRAPALVGADAAAFAATAANRDEPVTKGGLHRPPPGLVALYTRVPISRVLFPLRFHSKLGKPYSPLPRSTNPAATANRLVGLDLRQVASLPENSLNVSDKDPESSHETASGFSSFKS
jgi:hypothetical protein